MNIFFCQVPEAAQRGFNTASLLIIATGRLGLLAIFAVRGARQARGFPVQVRTAMVEGCVEVDRTALHGGKPGNLLEDILAARSEAKLRGDLMTLKVRG